MTLNPKFKDYLKQDFDRFYSLGADKMRQAYAQMMKDGKVFVEEVDSVVDRVVKTSVRDTLIRIYSPKGQGKHPVLIWMHGGGFVLGDIEHGDLTCRQITNKTNCTVISIDYALCPPHKFPDPENECYEIVKWVYNNAQELNVDSNRICIAGDSAGATLALVISFLARERKEFPLCYQVLVYGCYDWNDMGKRASRKENAEGYRLTAYGIEWHNHHHLKDRAVDGLNPMASPLLNKDFSNLPPALIITSEYDPLRDESIDLAKHLAAAGVEVELKNYPGIIHGFLAMRQLELEEISDAINLISKKVGEAFE